MRDRIMKKIFIFAIISLIVLPILIGIGAMIHGVTDSWSGVKLGASEAFWTGSILIYLLYLWPYILLALLYIIIYSILYRKTKLVKHFWLAILIASLIIFFSGSIITIN